ncbi:unnamed protein product [Cuscuta campestris]|uniref:Uncharacterized protein n=1 Tax=Cuscuta campestris TaxID=132261 RepID=A0A484NDI0_9ASTE|nr:unnamed protein product [Cuscuta campestris]
MTAREDRRRGPRRGPPLPSVARRRKWELVGGPPLLEWLAGRSGSSLLPGQGSPEWTIASGMARRWIDARMAVVRRLVPPEVKHARGLADLGGCSPTLVEGTAAGPVTCSLLAGKIPAVRGSPAVQTLARCRWNGSSEEVGARRRAAAAVCGSPEEGACCHCLWLAVGGSSLPALFRFEDKRKGAALIFFYFDFSLQPLSLPCFCSRPLFHFFTFSLTFSLHYGLGAQKFFVTGSHGWRQ